VVNKNGGRNVGKKKKKKKKKGRKKREIIFWSHWEIGVLAKPVKFEVASIHSPENPEKRAGLQTNVGYPHTTKVGQGKTLLRIPTGIDMTRLHCSRYKAYFEMLAPLETI